MIRNKLDFAVGEKMRCQIEHAENKIEIFGGKINKVE